MSTKDVQEWIADLVSGSRKTYAEILDGIVGTGKYNPDQAPRKYFQDMAKSTLCGLTTHSLVEWKGKLILFLGELHGNDSPCPSSANASNFFQSLMHVLTEDPDVALIYEGHDHMLKRDPRIIRRMVSKKYPFRVLNSPQSIVRSNDYLNIMRTIHVILLYASASNRRAQSLLKRMVCFDMREVLRMVSAWSRDAQDPERFQSSMDAVVEFIRTLKNVDTSDFQTQMERCTSPGACYKNIFIKAPDYYAASILASTKQKYVIVYGGKFHAENIPTLLPGSRFLARASCGDPNGSCSRPK